MAWTTPRTYTANEIISDSILNTDVRDNLAFLGTHGHSSAAGDGSQALGPLTRADFADQGTAPASTGRVQRNATLLQYYDGTVVANISGEGGTGTPSLRSLGTAGTQAAAGDHTHTPTSQAAVMFDATGNTCSGSLETDIISTARTPGGTNRSWVIYGALRPRNNATGTMRLYFDGTVLQARTGVVSDSFKVFGLASFKSAPTTASHTVKLTYENEVVSTFFIDAMIGLREVSVT